MTTASSILSPARSIQRWPTERPLFALCVLMSIGIWTLLIVSIIGVIYAVILGLFFLFAHAAFVAHVRGNGVRLSPAQFPDLFEAVRRLANHLGLEAVPEAYLMQAGGTLNAFATRFFRSNFIVLFTDLLEACDDNTAARDMIIAHELGHLKAGHLRWRWLIMPAYFFPFLGTLSRAREYTCDRYGLAGAGNVDGAILGLTVLAAGGKHAPAVNQTAFLAQRETLNTGWMAIGEWLSTHPPLAKRVAQLLPPAARDHVSTAGGGIRGAAIIGALSLVGTTGAVGAVALWTTVYSRLVPPTGAEFGQPAIDVRTGAAQVQSDYDRISALLEAHLLGGGALPNSWDEVEALWVQAYPDEPVPFDPFDGARYGYMVEEDSYVLWSSGPDAIPGTEDDIVMRPGAV